MSTTVTVIPSAPKRLDIKRFYLPFAIVGSCPKCGTETERTFERDPDYLSYPPLDAPFPVWLECGACEHEWTVSATLSVRLSLSEPTP
jgi:hypothetical protein